MALPLPCFAPDLQLDHFRLSGKRTDGSSAMLKVEHGHQIIIHRIHTAEGSGVVLHHGDAGLAANVFLDFALHADPSALVHPTDLHLAVFLHLLVNLLLVVGNDVQLALKLTYSTEGADMGLAVLLGGKIEGAAGLQILRRFVHVKTPFETRVVIFADYVYNYISRDSKNKYDIY